MVRGVAVILSRACRTLNRQQELPDPAADGQQGGGVHALNWSERTWVLGPDAPLTSWVLLLSSRPVTSSAGGWAVDSSTPLSSAHSFKNVDAPYWELGEGLPAPSTSLSGEF